MNQNMKARLPREITDLQEFAQSLPADQKELLIPMVQRVEAGYRRRHQLNLLIQESLSQLRLDIKYLEFDLASTRSERDTYKMELGQRDEF